jgi:hypothetical protein
VQATSDAGTFQGLIGSVLSADGHETGHLNLGKLDLATPEGSQRLHIRVSHALGIARDARIGTYDVSDLELVSGGGHGDRLEEKRKKNLFGPISFEFQLYL